MTEQICVRSGSDEHVSALATGATERGSEVATFSDNVEKSKSQLRPEGHGGVKVPVMSFKTVILYDIRKIRPQTLEAIQNAKDGDMIPCDPSEMGSFLPLVVHEPELVRVKHRQNPPKKATE